MNALPVLLPTVLTVAALFPTTGRPTVQSGGTWTRPPAEVQPVGRDFATARIADRAHMVEAPRVSPPPVRKVRPPVRIRTAAATSSVTTRRTPVVRVAPAGPSWEQRRGAEALRLISYPWRDLGWRISFHPARSGVLGIADAVSKEIHVYVRRNHSVRLLAFTVAHEIGHAYDFTRSTRESHNRWLELRGIDRDVPWYGCDGCGDLETPAGDFAEVFAAWQVGPVDFRSRMAPMPSAEEMDRLAQEFAS